MPATPDELILWVRAVADGVVMPDEQPLWTDGTHPDATEAREIQGLVTYELTLRRRRQQERNRWPARRRGLALLRSFLTVSQQEQLRRCWYYDLPLPSGRIYRLHPTQARVVEVELHGKRLYEVRRFCLHPPEPHDLPEVDVSLQHLLLLSADEEEFRHRANITLVASDMWNGEYLRRMRRARRERAARAAEWQQLVIQFGEQCAAAIRSGRIPTDVPMGDACVAPGVQAGLVEWIGELWQMAGGNAENVAASAPCRAAFDMMAALSSARGLTHDD